MANPDTMAMLDQAQACRYTVKYAHAYLRGSVEQHVPPEHVVDALKSSTILFREIVKCHTGEKEPLKQTGVMAKNFSLKALNNRPVQTVREEGYSICSSLLSRFDNIIKRKRVDSVKEIREILRRMDALSNIFIFMSVWREYTPTLFPELEATPLTVCSDASGTGGIGIIAENGMWAQIQKPRTSKLHELELDGMLTAIELFKDHMPLHVICDSSAAVQALGRGVMDPKTWNKELRFRRNEIVLQYGDQVSTSWVKGHADNTLNNVADWLSKNPAGKAPGVIKQNLNVKAEKIQTRKKTRRKEKVAA